MREDGFVSYDRYLARDYGPWIDWTCDECDCQLDDDGNCPDCFDGEDDE